MKVNAVSLYSIHPSSKTTGHSAFDGVKKDSPQVYELYGLRVCSDIVLPAPLSQDLLSPYDVEIRFSSSKATTTNPTSARLLAKLNFEEKPIYTLIDTGTGYTLSFHQRCEFWISYDLRLVNVSLFPGVQPDIAGLFLVNGVIACILTLSGECVLHSSAVEIGGKVLAFLGGSGMSKSTLAASFCTMGAQFVTDDLLRLKSDGKTFYCFPGTGRIRLRKDASLLAEKFSEIAQVETPDNRIELNLGKVNSMPPLGAIVIPIPSPDCKVLKIERLPTAKAVLYLMAYTKVQGLQEREHIQGRLEFCANLASSIPVFEVEIPWGISSLEQATASLARGVGFELPREVSL